jgi:hypothetical protein
MIPGQGEVIKFNIDSTGKITSLTYSGSTFVRAPAN